MPPSPHAWSSAAALLAGNSNGVRALDGGLANERCDSEQRSATQESETAQPGDRWEKKSSPATTPGDHRGRRRARLGNYNACYRDNPRYRVVALTAAQIPDIEGRLYPSELADEGYSDGIPIYPESDVDQVVFAYSDVTHEYVMHRASLVLAAGADYRLMGGKTTMPASSRPVVSVCAVRTGSGKSQTTRRVCDALREMGKLANPPFARCWRPVLP